MQNFSVQRISFYNLSYQRLAACKQERKMWKKRALLLKLNMVIPKACFRPSQTSIVNFL